MPGYTLTPNMSLRLPTVFDDINLWGNDLNAGISILDSHDHSSGSGVKVTPLGLNINSDLDIQENNLININELRYNLLGSLPSDIQSTYVAGSGGDLFYNDKNGNQIQLTVNGFVNATASTGQILGLGGDDTIVFTDSNNRLSFNADGVASSMILQAGEYQAPQYTFGILGVQNMTYSGGHFNFNNAALGNGSLRFANWFADATNNIDFDVIQSRFQFNTASVGDANILAGGITLTHLNAIELSFNGTPGEALIGPINISDKLTKVTLRANTTEGLDSHSGAYIELFGASGDPNDGSIRYNAFGVGTNEHVFSVRTGVDTSSDIASVDSFGSKVYGFPVVTSAQPSTTPLRIVRGHIDTAGSGSIIVGEGFTITKLGTGNIDITFNPPFAEAGVIVATGGRNADTIAEADFYTGDPTKANVQLVSPSPVAPIDARFNFIAIGQM